MKIVNKRNLGLRARDKFFLHLILTFIVFFLMSFYYSESFTHLVFHNQVIDLKLLYFLFLYFLISGFSNATNLTDGLDGLLATLSIVSLLGYSIVFWFLGYYSIFWLIIAFCSFLLVFLIFNFPKAKVFMGDCGSLSIGGFFVFLALVSKTEPYLLFFGFSFFIITLSVILQVFYFKLTKGKRLFSITPLHHHFEMMGYSEKEILFKFNSVNLVFVIIGVYFTLYKFIGGG
jgi:phospho-N-acetylmuramoyl-pentapeptide-transferase